MAVALGVAALDAYMHSVVLRKINAIKKNPPKSLRRLQLDFGDLADLTNLFIERQRTNSQSRPWVHAKEALRRRLTKETFQTYDQIASSLAMAGVQQGWSQICHHLHLTDAQVRNTLSRINHQRNKIVHEGDIVRLARPRSIKLERINPSQVRKDLRWIEALIHAIDQIV